MWGPGAQYTISPSLDSFIHSFNYPLVSAWSGPEMVLREHSPWLQSGRKGRQEYVDTVASIILEILQRQPRGKRHQLWVNV